MDEVGLKSNFIHISFRFPKGNIHYAEKLNIHHGYGVIKRTMDGSFKKRFLGDESTF